MALSLIDSGNLMNDMELRLRIKVAALKYATYVLGQQGITQSASQWARNTTTMPDQTALQLQPMVVMDPAVQDGAGKEIEDQPLQTTVETVIKKLI